LLREAKRLDIEEREQRKEFNRVLNLKLAPLADAQLRRKNRSE
jgi:hypothetical protein